jgi:hypothetical protein
LLSLSGLAFLELKFAEYAPIREQSCAAYDFSVAEIPAALTLR